MRLRDLKLPVFGASQFLDYAEAKTEWVVRIADEQCATRPHACFVHMPLLAAIDDPAFAENPRSVSRVLREHLARLRENQAYRIVLDYSHEGPAFDGRFGPKFIALHSLLHELAIPSHKVTFLHHNRVLLAPDTAYVTWCRRHGETPMRMVNSHWWLLHQSALFHARYQQTNVFEAHENRLLGALDPESTQKTHKYLCFNYYPRLHRVLLLLALLERDVLTEGLVSFPGFRIPEAETDFLQDTLLNIDGWRMGRRLKPQLDRLQLLAPLRVDSDDSATKSTLEHHFVDTPFLDTAFSVVTDTGFGDGTLSRRITEKFLKPVLHLHPLLLLGEPGSLNLMRDLGFRTFEPFFDESYDDVFEPEQRLDRIVDIVSAKCQQSQRQILAEIRTLLPALQANLRHVAYGLWPRVRSESEYPVINHLLDALDLPGPRIATPYDAERCVPIATITANDEVVALPRDLLQTIPIGAEFDWGSNGLAEGVVYRTLRPLPVPGNHCVVFRVNRNLERPFRVQFGIRPNGARRLLIQLKDPGNDRYRGVFDFELGVFISTQNVDALSNVQSAGCYDGNGWFTLQCSGQVGSGPGPLDIVLYVGTPEFDCLGDPAGELWLADITVERRRVC